jgi:hypothetical protein
LGDQRRIAEADPIIVQHLYWFLFWKWVFSTQIKWNRTKNSSGTFLCPRNCCILNRTHRTWHSVSLLSRQSQSHYVPLWSNSFLFGMTSILSPELVYELKQLSRPEKILIELGISGSKGVAI